MKPRNIVLIVSLVLISTLGGMAWFAGTISSAYPPIRTYKYSNDYSHFIADLKRISDKNLDILYKQTDRTGDSIDGYKYYFDIRIKNDSSDYAYHISYDPKIDLTGDVGLIYVSDEKRNIASYKFEDQNIQNLNAVFQERFKDLIEK